MDVSDKPLLLVVCGPTASGKTELAIEICRRFQGEMVGADSMQVYSGLSVGTAALQQDTAVDVPRHLIGTIPPCKTFSVAEYVAQADKCIREIWNSRRLPVLCGGTGLYIESLISGVRFSPFSPLPQLREDLYKRMQQQGTDVLLQELALHDPQYAAKLSIKDAKRILRGLEEWHTTNMTYDERKRKSHLQEPAYRSFCIGLNFSERSILYERIEMRIDTMLCNGLLNEAQWVYSHRSSFYTAAQAIGYKEFFPFFDGEKTLENCVLELKKATRNYAKRQLTWFRRMKDIVWLDSLAYDLTLQAAKLTEEFLHENQYTTYVKR